MKSLAAPIRDKLARLIPRLSTSFDAEAIGTVRAIQRTLSGAGHDLHDLAAALANEPHADHRGDQARDRHHNTGHHVALYWEELSSFDRRRWLDAMVYEAVFTDWERNFLDSVRRQFLDRGDRMRFSDKQLGICNRLLWKAVREGVSP